MAAVSSVTARTSSAPGPVRRALSRLEVGTLIAALAIAVFFAFRTARFATSGGIADVLDVSSMVGIMAVAVGMLLIGGEFDLSAGVLTASCGLIPAILIDRLGVNAWEGIGWALLFALLVGLLNGVLVTSTRLPGIIVTLATFFVLQGANVALTRDLTGTSRVGGVDTAKGFDSAHALFAATLTLGGANFPAGIAWWIGVTLLATLVLVRTKFGNWVFGSGGAPAAARAAGVPVRRTKVALFMTTSAAAWLVGTISVVRLNGVQAGGGVGDQFGYIIAAVIGGCLITGGLGSVIGASIGALIYGMTKQGIEFASWDASWFPVALGVLLLLAVAGQSVVRRGKEPAG